MTIIMVECFEQITLFADQETADKSIAETREKLVGGGFIGNLGCTISEIIVHERPFAVLKR